MRNKGAALDKSPPPPHSSFYPPNNSHQEKTSPANISLLSPRTATNWLCNFIVVEITPTGIETLGWRFYIIWTVFNLSFVPLVYFFYPETAARTLEDIDQYFRDHSNILVHRDPEATSAKRPALYIEKEEGEVRRRSVGGSVSGTAAARRDGPGGGDGEKKAAGGDDGGVGREFKEVV
jgi:hypothetical protein